MPPHYEDGTSVSEPAEETAPPALETGMAPPDDPSEAAAGTRRTMFRRMTGGALQETGAGELEQFERRRRRRRDPGEITDAHLRPGQSRGRYTFLGTVGEGAMGRVLLARDASLRRKVAYKAMSAEIAAHSTMASKFTAEAQITAQLDHPNIVPVYDLEGDAAYTMKLIKGRTLEDLIAETQACHDNGTLDEEHSLQARLELFLRACDAMSYAHSRGVVHRDLKPENIMVGAFGELYVMDWGIAHVMNGEFDDKVELGGEPEAEGDLVIGTPGYMSPEQAEGHNERLDGRSDQYALGLILFELVTLRRAVTGKTPVAIVMRHQDGDKEPLVHAYNAPIPAEVAAIVHKATQKDPADRYENVKALADDIRRYLRGEAVHARPDTLLQSVLRWTGKHKELTLLAMFTLILLSTALAMGSIFYGQTALAAQRVREQQLTNLLTVVARQSSLIDGRFLKYEGLLSVIATMAVEKLGDPTFSESPIYQVGDFDDPARRPTELVASSRYGREVSLQHSVFALAEPDRGRRLYADMQRLADLDDHFYRVLLRSHSEEAATYTPKRAQRALAEVGTPVAWAYVGLDNGVYIRFPGHGGLPEGFDHRESPWFALAANQRGPTWGAPSVDPSGMGLVLSCAQALVTKDDSFLGVAGIDVTFDHLIHDLLEAPEFKGSSDIEAFLLDPEGRVAVRSSARDAEPGASGAGGGIEMPAFHHPEVVQAIKEKRSGHLQGRGPDGPELVVYNRMGSIGWYYVVVGDVDAMLARGG